MAFEKKPAPWHNPGIEPPEELKITGWKAGMRPPADYFNWQWNRTYLALEELQQKASEIKTINGQGPDENGNINVEVDYSKSAKKEDFEKHVNSTIYESEVHGVRIREGVLEYWNGMEWLVAQLGERPCALPISPIAKLTAEAGDRKVRLSWVDPYNISIGGIELSRWEGTKILRKTNGYPVDENDGVLVVSSTSRDQYALDPFVDTNVINGITYYYAAFPYNQDGQYTIHDDQRAKATPQAGLVDNPDPEVDGTGVFSVSWHHTHPNEGLFLTNAIKTLSGHWNQGNTHHGGELEWANKVFSPWPDTNPEYQNLNLDGYFPFVRMRPVLFKDGKVITELDRSDYSKDVFGNYVDIYSGNLGDVMIEIPRIYFNIGHIATNDSSIRVHYSAKKAALINNAIGHKKGTADKEFIYVGAYMGSNMNGQLRSLSGKPVETRKNIAEYRNMARTNGTGYEIMSYNQYMMLMLLYFFQENDFTPNRYPRTTAYDEKYIGRITGTTDKSGFNAPKKSNIRQDVHHKQWFSYDRVKMFGIEDLYGSYNTWLDGLRSDENCDYLIGTSSFNTEGVGYTKVESGFGSFGHHISEELNRPASVNLNSFLLPINTYEDIERGPFSKKLSLRPNMPFITGTGNPTGKFFDFVFSDYVELDPSLVSYNGARLVYA